MIGYSRLRLAACVTLILLTATTTAVAEEPADLRQHLVMVHAETVPPGINKYFPAIVVAATESKSILVSSSWGAAPFPIGAKGRAIDSIHLLGSDQPVEILKYDETDGVAVFSVDTPLKPWPIDQLPDEIKVGDHLEELVLENRHYKPRKNNRHRVTAIRTELPGKSTDGTEFKVKGTIVFEGDTSGHPGTVLLKNGKLAAVFLNNSSAGGSLKHYALPARLFLTRYRTLLRD